MSAPQTTSPLDAVVAELQQLISWTLTQPSRIGFFASLYLRVTNTIRSKLGTGYFDNDARLEQLDFAFASRYLSAVQQFRSNDPALSKAWAVALDATNQNNLIVVQHLLLAMNPHINIDLAVACAQTSPGSAINSLQGDFNKINAILATVVPTVISELSSLSPYLHLLADLAEDPEKSFINFGLDAARAASWQMAQKLANLNGTQQQQLISGQDQLIAAISEKIISPGLVLAGVLDIVRSAEVKDPVQIIDTLNAQAAAPLQLAALASVPTAPSPANRVYYFEVAPGSWTGTFTFQITNWGTLWRSSMSLKNKLLASAMQIFHKIAGDSTISSELTPYPDQAAAGVALNRIRIHKSWLTLWRSNEQYTLHPNGHKVTVDARVNFGPIPFLFREHDVYPASVIDGGMRNLYHIKLLGTRFLGDYRVQPDRRQVRSTLSNDWAIAHEVLNKTT